MKSTIFWHITPCSPLKANRRFGGTCRLHIQGRRIGQARNQRETGSKQSLEVKLHAFLTSALDGSGQLHVPAALLPRETAPGTNCTGIWVGPHSRSEHCGAKSLTLIEIDTRFLGRPARSLLALPTEIYRLSLQTAVRKF
jgi:hypothetical protein